MGDGHMRAIECIKERNHQELINGIEEGLKINMSSS